MIEISLKYGVFPNAQKRIKNASFGGVGTINYSDRLKDYNRRR